MSQIIKQPNGKYCLFSNIVDSITHYDMSEEEIVEVYVEEVREEYKRKVKNVINQLEKEEKPYHQFTMTFDECIETIKEVHGEAEAENTRKIIENK
jgi:hypothetical protein